MIGCETVEISSIPAREKQFFLKWFIDYYRLKNNEVKWFLEYLLNNEDVLDRICFTGRVEGCPRAIVMQVIDFGEVSFKFIKGPVVTTDVDKSFHDLRMKKEIPMFIQIDFLQATHPPFYWFLLEDNPFLPPHIKGMNPGEFRDKQGVYEKPYGDPEENLKQKIVDYKKAIDKALDARDEEEFYRLTNQLRILEREGHLK